MGMQNVQKMRNNLGGTNDVNVISYGRENIGGEEANKIMQCLEMNMGKKKKTFPMITISCAHGIMDNCEFFQRRMMTKE
jgi:hypothetical protein